MEALAAQQLERFARDGITPTPAQIIALNDAARALAKARARGGASFFHAPRVRHLGGIRFHEPTIQSELWMNEVASEISQNPQTWNLFLAFSLAHADEAGFFDTPEMRRFDTCEKAVRRFLRSLPVSSDALLEVLNYCVYGDEPQTKSKSDNSKPPADEFDIGDALWRELATAIGLTGASPRDLKTLTLPLLRQALRSVYELQGGKFEDADVTDASRQWYGLVKEITETTATKPRPAATLHNTQAPTP